MKFQSLSALLLLAAISSAAAAPWELGDTFATTHGRLNVIDSKTLKVKQVVNLFARNGVTICPGKISGGAFNPQGSLLYLACESKNKVIVVDASTTRQHRVLANFTTEGTPTGIAVDKSGTLYVAHNSQKGEPGVVHKYSATGQHLGQALASDAITAQQGTGIAAMKLAGDSSKLLLTTGGSLVQQVDIETQKPVPGAAPHGPEGAKCFGFDTLADGSILLACNTCVYTLATDGTPTGRSFCPEGAGLALQHVAVHPSNNFFIVADANSNLLFKVSLQNWGASTKFTVPRANKIQGLFTLGSVDDSAFQGARRRAEQDWADNIKGKSGKQQPADKPQQPATRAPEAPQQQPRAPTTMPATAPTTQGPAQQISKGAPVQSPIKPAPPVQPPRETAVQQPIDQHKDASAGADKQPHTPADKPAQQTAQQPAEKPAKKPAEKPAAQPAQQPAPKSADKPTKKPADKPADKPAAQQPAQPMQPAANPADKPADKPTEKPADKLAEKPVEKPAQQTAQPAVKPAGKPAEKPVGKPSLAVEKPAQAAQKPAAQHPAQHPAQPATKTAEKPAAQQPAGQPAQSVAKPADKAARQPADKPAEQPAQPATKPAEKPVEKFADKPAEKLADKPAANSVEQAASKPIHKTPEQLAAPAKPASLASLWQSLSELLRK